VDKLLESTRSLGQFALLRCSVEIHALCRRCQLADKRMHVQRRTNLRPPNESEQKRQG
jgi:hypothetical protein